MAKMMTNSERLAERKRVDEFMAKKKGELRAGKKPEPEKQYPMSTRLMGQGFMNLFDSLRGQFTPKGKK